MKVQKIAYLLIVFIALVAILHFGESLLIPIIFAVFLWFIIREMRRLIDRIDFFKKYIPGWIKNLLVSILILGVLGGTSSIITMNIRSLSNSFDKYEKNAEKFLEYINSTFDINLVELITDQLGNIDFTGILSSVFNSLTEIVGNAFIILIYAVFVFLEETHFTNKLKKALGPKYSGTSEILHKIESSIRSYLGLKTLLSFTTGLLSYFALLIIGIEAPAFWAFLIFILNYIPTIGSLIATLFPAVFGIFQFGEFLPAGLVLIFVGSIQVLVGNLLEPRLMGNSLNVSSLVAIISLTLWGALWGVTGMIISVPVTVMMVIVFAQFNSTRPMAIMLSEKGEV